MKEFFLKNPYSTGFVIFLIIMIGSVGLGIIVANVTYNPDIEDPHGLRGGLIITVALGASLVIGILSGLTTTYFLLEKTKANKIP